MTNAGYKILIGDINFDLQRTSLNANKNLTAEFGYLKMINTTYRYRHASKSCLDQTFDKTTHFSKSIKL